MAFVLTINSENQFAKFIVDYYLVRCNLHYMKQIYSKICRRTIMRRGLALMVILCCVFNTHAQISLTSTAGTTTGTYTTLRAAIDNINNGTHQGVINIQVHTNTTETSGISLVESGNISGAIYTSILIRPADTATTLKTVSATLAGQTLLTLNGADNVTIDGRPLSIGTQRLLSISNTSTNLNSHTVVLTSNATNNSILNTILFNGSLTVASTASVIRFVTGSNDNFTLTNSTLNGGNLGLEIAGTVGTPNTGLNITRNLFLNQKSSSIRLAGGVGNMLIDSNDCTHTIPTATAGFQFININTIEPTATVTLTKNRVYDLNTSAANFLHGVFISTTSPSGTIIIRNNSISIGSAAFPNTLSQAIRGLLFTGTFPLTCIVEHNTFRIGGTHLNGGNNPITVGYLKANTSALSTFTCRNNICINTRTGTVNQHVGAFVNTPTTGTNNIDYNTYFGGPTFTTAWVGNFHANITTYRAAAFPNEQNSTFGLVDFNNSTEPTINLAGPNVSGANLAGLPISVTNDYFGNSRSTTRPYRGAFEGSTPIDTFDLQTQIIYTYGKIPIGTDDTVRAIVRNLGALPVTNIPISLYSSKAGLIGTVNVSLAAGAQATINLAPYTPALLGLDTLLVFPTPDQRPSNDTARWIRENTLNALAYTNVTLPRTNNVGTNGQGEIVAKFFTPVSNFLNQVNVNFTNPAFISPNPFQVVIYADSGSTFGPRRVPLWVSSTQNTVNGIFNLSIPNIQVSGYFYIGVRQTSSNNIGFAYQNENPIRDRTFYFRQDDTGPAGQYLGLPWNDFAVNPNNQFRFMIEPRLKINDDLGVVDLIAPGNGCVNQGPQQIRVLVQNLGLLTQNFAVDTLKVFGRITKPSGTVFNYGPINISSGSLGSDDTLSVVLVNNFNIDTLGQYSFTAWARLLADNNNINDTLPLVQRNLVASSSVPNAQSFNSSLVFPNTWLTNRFNVSANNGVGNSNSIRVNIDGTNNFTATAFIQSPRLTGVTANTALRFDYRLLNNLGGTPATLTANDSIKILVSTNCGITFTQIGLISAANHISSSVYTPAQFSLAAFSGNDVIVKISYDWFGTTNNVIVDMDNVRIVETNPDAGVTGTNLCRAIIAGTASFAPQVTVRNFGTATQTNIPVNVSITGPVNYNGTATVAALASGNSISASLTTNFNPTTAGTYSVKAWTSITSDGDLLNDTFFFTFNVVNIVPAAAVLNQGSASGSGLVFGGSSSLNVANSASLNITNELTLEAWINRAGAGRRTIITKDSSIGFLQYELLINDSNKLEFSLFTTSAFVNIAATPTIPLGFTHVAATFDGSKIRLYMNGNIVLDTILTSSTIVPQNFPVTIGNSSNVLTPFLGTIDELRVWNVARTPQQIRSNMHTRLANASNVNLVGYYRFDEGLGNTFVTDFSGNCNTGTFGTFAPVWITTQFPLGTPVVQNQTITVDGNYTFTGTGLTLGYNGMVGTDTTFVVRFAGLPVGTSPLTNPGGITAVHPNYWIVYRFGNGTTTSIDVEGLLGAGNLLSGVQTTDLRLFNRANGSAAAWTQLNASASVANFATQTVRFAQTSAMFGTQLSIGAVNNPLPVEWLSFKGTLDGSTAKLEWSVASEKNNSGFAVERSIDGLTFTEIGFIKGNGNHNVVTSYGYSDEGIMNQTKVVYYRIKQIDFNGKTSYSKTIRINDELNSLLAVSSLYPNPMSDVLSIELSQANNDELAIELYDMTGKLVAFENINRLNGNNVVSTNAFKDVPAGLYVIQVKSSGALVFKSKLIKENN